MTTAYPPIHHHSTTRISPSTALSHLSAYLEATITDPWLHPNALLTENGPITPSAGAGTGLVLHNLRRVEAGLRGKQLGADLAFDEYGGEGLPGATIAGDAVAGANEIPNGYINGQGKALEGGWQDKEEFEREQDIVQGEVGRRDNAVDGESVEKGGRMPKVKATRSAGDKETRKRAKKEKRKKERAAAELAKQMRDKDAEG